MVITAPVQEESAGVSGLHFFSVSGVGIGAERQMTLHGCAYKNTRPARRVRNGKAQGQCTTILCDYNTGEREKTR